VDAYPEGIQGAALEFITQPGTGGGVGVDVTGILHIQLAVQDPRAIADIGVVSEMSGADARQLAMVARDQAQKGGTVVGQAVAAMEEINTASQRIAAIISVIDEIAFQTNLLALNAAVEAARAGEQGRGFAVVAAEVRNLASRSATSARQIKALIEDSVKKVEDGSRLIELSGRTLGEIVAAVKKVNDVVGEIAVASQEQSSGIEQVNRAVTHMDQVTQQASLAA
jgi:methyl-accepting chemotaxis protein